jgi:hypothetical protein
VSSVMTPGADLAGTYDVAAGPGEPGEDASHATRNSASGMESTLAAVQVAPMPRSFLAREYLSGYLSAGGAAVKVAVVGEASAADRLESALAAETAGSDGLFVSVPAELVRVHMIDQIFFAISQTIAWEDLAAECVRSAYEQASFPVPDGTDLAVARVARHHDGDISELYRSVRRLLERNLFANPVIATEMGRAMLRLAQAHLGSGDVDASEREAVSSPPGCCARPAGPAG